MTSPQPPYGFPPPPPPANPGMSTGKKIGLGCGGCLGVLLFLLLLGGCVAALSGDDLDSGAAEPAATREETAGDAAGGAAEEESAEETAAEEPAAEEAVEEEPAQEEPEAPSSIGSGIHRVGEDIEPGTYTTDGPDPDDILPMCYYARLSGLSGEFDDIIANNNIEGPGSVVVQEGDVALELSGDCEWTLE